VPPLLASPARHRYIEDMGGRLPLSADSPRRGSA